MLQVKSLLCSYMYNIVYEYSKIRYPKLHFTTLCKSCIANLFLSFNSQYLLLVF